MSPRDLLAFSAGALRGHRLRTGLSLLGVAIGVASVVLLTSLGEGARLYVTGEFASLGTNLVIVLPGKTETTGVTPFISGVTHDLTVEDAETILRRVRPARRIAGRREKGASDEHEALIAIRLDTKCPKPLFDLVLPGRHNEALPHCDLASAPPHECSAVGERESMRHVDACR